MGNTGYSLELAIKQKENIRGLDKMFRFAFTGEDQYLIQFSWNKIYT